MAIMLTRQHHEQLRKLARLPELEAVLAALRAAPAQAYLNDLARWIADRTKVDPDDIADVLSVAAHLLDSRSSADKADPRAFVAKVVAELSQSGAEEPPAPEEVSEVGRRLTSVFASSATLELTAKAQGVALDYENSLFGARILTDMRPIFDEDPDRGLNSALIMHNLRLSYFGKDENRRHFYVALDSSDLAELQDLVTRALKKDQAIRKVLEEAGVKFITPQKRSEEA